MMTALSESVALPPGVVARVERVRQAADQPVPDRFLHFHGPAELVLIEAGTGHCAGEAGVIAFGPGAVLVIPAMAIHDFAFDPGPRAWTLVQFDPSALPDGALPALAGPAAAALPPVAQARAAVAVEWLAERLAEAGAAREAALLLEVLLLAVRDGLTAAAPVPAAGAAGPGRFRPLLDHLARHPGEMLDLAGAASLCGWSPTYFSRRFSATFGLGFSAYQVRMKLLQAARMLATGPDSVSTVAYRLGFGSHAHFSHCYRAMFGVPPSRHRRRAAQSGRAR